MSYRIGDKKHPKYRDMQKTTTPSTIYINNGETGVFACPNYYDIIEDNYQRKSNLPIYTPKCKYEYKDKPFKHNLKPIKLIDEGYSNPVCILHDAPDGLAVANCRIKPNEQHVVEVTLYAECPEVIEESHSCLFTLKAQCGTISVGGQNKPKYDIVTQGKIVVLPGLI